MVAMRIILLIVCFVVSETISARVERAFGGKVIPIEDAAHFVSIQESDQHKCCGALISWKHVLTTASCIFDKFEKLHFGSTVISGTHRKYAWGTRRTITKFSPHPRFMLEDRNPYFDISILTLSGLVPEDGKHVPIEFPIDPPVHLTKGSLTVFGKMKKQSDSIYLHRLSVLILSPNESTSIQAGADPKYSNVFKGIIEQPQSSEDSDVGGPLLYNDKLIGIVSQIVTENCLAFMNVYEFSGFISQILFDV